MSGREAAGEGDTLAPTWRHLAFYEASRVHDAADYASSPSTFHSPNEVACVSSWSKLPAFLQPSADGNHANGSTSSSAKAPQRCILVGDIKGSVKVLDADGYEEIGSWPAFHGASLGGIASATGRVTHISCDAKGRLVTLGEDEHAKFPLIRIWDLSAAATNKPHAPRLLAEGKVQHGSRPFPIAALAHTTTLSFLSIGLADGSVLLLRGLDDVLKAAPKDADGFSSTNPAVALPKFKVAFQPSAVKNEPVASFHEAVTGLGFAESSSKHSLLDKVAGKTAQNGTGSRKGLSNAVTRGSASKGEDRSSLPDTVTLFIVTLTRILRYTVVGKGAGLPASVIDDVGCALGCAKLIPRNNRLDNLNSIEGKMVVARDEAIYVVGTEGREMSLAYEGPKASIQLAATQLVIVSPPIKASSDSASATARQYMANKDRNARLTLAAVPTRTASPKGFPSQLEVAKVTVFDLDNKLVAYSGTFEGGVREAWVGIEGDICILSDDATLTRLEEKTLRQKLDILFRKSLYLLAVSVAKSHVSRSLASSFESDKLDSLLAEIHCKYADFLYDKGDFEGAISQFVKTIGFTQPSYVIRKFLDAQRITNLTTYLQELHFRGMANSDHTTLLLNCYTKLKDVASLDRFIKRPIGGNTNVEEGERDPLADDEEGADGKKELPFDLDTAIRVCRQAGYFDHAAYLARGYGQHDEYIRIQVEDVHEYEKALNHIRGLSAEEAERNLIRYGKILLDNIPSQTTAMLIELCSGAFQPTPMAVGAGVDATKAQSKSTAAAYLSYIQVGAFGKSSSPKVATTSVNPSSAPVTTRGAPEEQAIDEKGLAEANENGGGVGTPGGAPSDSYSVPLPRVFFAHFISHPQEFEMFLEMVALARWDQSIDDAEEDTEGDMAVVEISLDAFDNSDEYVAPDKREQMSIWNTLLELYLTQSRPVEMQPNKALVGPPRLDGAQRLSKKGKALRLLRQHQQLPYNVSQALLVCSQEEFEEGVVFLYERLGMYEDIMRLHMDQGLSAGANDEKESHSLMRCLNRYGDFAPQLYPMALAYLASSERLLSSHHSEMEKIIEHIEEERLLSPLEVVQMLSKKSVASVGLIRAYLIRSIRSQQADMETNSKLSKTYRSETMDKMKEIEMLKDLQQPKIFQQTQCNACRGTLDLPIVHFMCKHSFHSRCLGEEEKECPLCAKSHGVILEIRKNNMAFGERQDLFLNEVEEAEDGFDVVASMFSKGLFGPQQLGERTS